VVDMDALSYHRHSRRRRCSGRMRNIHPGAGARLGLVKGESK
jgi:hypothetical protein